MTEKKRPKLNNWQTTISEAIQSIVSIRFSQVFAFDTEGPDTSEATGFVVDAKRGLILTNRHGSFIKHLFVVTCAGAFVGEAVFNDHEEVDVAPVYRDPVSGRVFSYFRSMILGNSVLFNG
jgi:hypothetical protein